MGPNGASSGLAARFVRRHAVVSSAAGDPLAGARSATASRSLAAAGAGRPGILAAGLAASLRCAGSPSVRTCSGAQRKLGHVNPIQGPLHRLAPAGITRGTLVVVPRRCPPLVLSPVGPQIGRSRPEPDRQARRVGHT